MINSNGNVIMYIMPRRVKGFYFLFTFFFPGRGIRVFISTCVCFEQSLGQENGTYRTPQIAEATQQVVN